jgi:hypothetical protein
MATACPLSDLLATAAHPPAYQPPAPNVLGRPAADQTEYFLTGATLGKKKKKQETKFQNPEPPVHKKLLHTMLH